MAAGRNPFHPGSEQRRITHDFTTWTSAHGIPHIGRAKNKIMIAFWTVVSLIAFGLLVWQVTSLVMRYLRYDVAVGMELRFEQRAYPAVTICNLNPYINTLVESEPQVQKLLSAYEYALNRSCRADSNCRKDEKGGLEADLVTYGFDQVNDSAALQSKAKNLLALVAADLNADQLVTTQKQMIRSCSFNAKDCDDKDFSRRLDPRMGACFTFNGQKTPRYLAKRAGPIYGLRLILVTDTSQYLSVSDAAGARIVVHGQQEEPFPDIIGYNVETGTATGMGVTFREVNRLSEPYGHCVDITKPPSHFLYKNNNYSTEACQRSCFQHKLERECTCSDFTYPQGNTRLGYCKIDNKKQRECWQRVSEEGVMAKDGCLCEQPCTEGVYDVTVSAAKFPAASLTKIADCTEGDAHLKDQSCFDYYRDNSVMVEIFYEKLNYQRLDESPAYEFVNLASDFGGQVGLWLGLSIISFVEFCVLMVMLCRSMVKKGQRPTTPQSPSILPPTPAHPAPAHDLYA